MTLFVHLKSDDTLIGLCLSPGFSLTKGFRVMVADANAQRKYEDGKALAEALGDIRLEIGRVTQKAIN